MKRYKLSDDTSMQVWNDGEVHLFNKSNEHASMFVLTKDEAERMARILSAKERDTDP